VADVDVRIAQGGDEGGHGRDVAHGPQHHGGEVADLLVGIAEQGDRGGTAGAPSLT
jgi:hypothetical protein